MNIWLRIDEQKPYNEQPVFYYFGFFDKIYKGAYSTEEVEFSGKILVMDCFYGKSGFLSDDVTYWMPRIEGNEFFPEHPTKEQKKSCIFHPLQEDINED